MTIIYTILSQISPLHYSLDRSVTCNVHHHKPRDISMDKGLSFELARTRARDTRRVQCFFTNKFDISIKQYLHKCTLSWDRLWQKSGDDERTGNVRIDRRETVHCCYYCRRYYYYSCYLVGSEACGDSCGGVYGNLRARMLPTGRDFPSIKSYARAGSHDDKFHGIAPRSTRVLFNHNPSYVIPVP